MVCSRCGVECNELAAMDDGLWCVLCLKTRAETAERHRFLLLDAIEHFSDKGIANAVARVRGEMTKAKEIGGE